MLSNDMRYAIIDIFLDILMSEKIYQNDVKWHKKRYEKISSKTDQIQTLQEVIKLLNSYSFNLLTIQLEIFNENSSKFTSVP